ncbi:hypothetical protein GWK47_043147 [Chionoecetes opilio]|uniref:TauD/TfdA-like domain-containing protein n=1 Tax=Chionoecetes opilio TaxID=41210 RepID=A0A8J5CWA0_CHIOP|nr:hypothetical protein GWK47_043147 [Chionoecetes opilio]
MTTQEGKHNYYKLVPGKLGCEVWNIDLKKDVPAEVVAVIKEEVTKHRILIFKDQGVISGDRHVRIAKWFQDPDSTFYKHPQSPHPDVFRVSNDRTEGCTNVGRTGWHIDGSFQALPFGYALYHMVSVPKNGPTMFCPLTEIIEQLSHEQRVKWERLHMISDRQSGPVHPLIYSHPLTKKKWSVGDFIISDNLSVAHEAAPETQLPRSEVGLRVLHRVTTKGLSAPTKLYDYKKELGLQ